MNENEIMFKSRFNRWLIKSQEYILFALGAVDTIIMFMIVVFRYVLKKPLFGLDELVLITALMLYFIGCAYGSVTDTQIRADIIDEMLKKPSRQKKFRVFTRFLELIPACFFAHLSFGLCSLTERLDIHSSLLRIPLLIPQAVMTLSFILIILYTLMYIWNDIQLIRQGHLDDPKPEAKED